MMEQQHSMATGQQLYAIRVANVDDISQIEWIDTFGTSPRRLINRDVEKYFGSVDPSVHERNVIFLAIVSEPSIALEGNTIIAKAELLLAPLDHPSDVGYIKRVVVHPTWRGKGIARVLLKFIENHAVEYGLHYLDLHVYENNTSALHLYDALGYQIQHRELYLRKDLTQETTPE